MTSIDDSHLRCKWNYCNHKSFLICLHTKEKGHHYSDQTGDMNDFIINIDDSFKVICWRHDWTVEQRWQRVSASDCITKELSTTFEVSKAHSYCMRWRSIFWIPSKKLCENKRILKAIQNIPEKPFLRTKMWALLDNTHRSNEEKTKRVKERKRKRRPLKQVEFKMSKVPW